MTKTQRKSTGIPVQSITSGNVNKYVYGGNTADLSISERSLLSFLASKLHWGSAEQGIVLSQVIKVSEMAEVHGVCRQSVQRWLAKLCEAGEVVKETRFSATGRQRGSRYSFPKLIAFLRDLKASEVVDDLTRDDAELDLDEDLVAERSVDAAPTLQGFSKKKNTYLKFDKKSDFLKVTGSVRYSPRLVAIIRRQRPGACPDRIFKFFKEFIQRDDFVLRKGGSYISLLFWFAKRCTVPYFGDYTPVKRGLEGDTSGSEAVQTDFSKYEPQGTDVVGRIRTLLFKLNPVQYKNWFYDADIKVEGSSVTCRGKSSFTTEYIKTRHADMLSDLCKSLGFELKILA